MLISIKTETTKRLELDVDTLAGRYLFFGWVLVLSGILVLHLLGVAPALTVADGMVRFEEERILFPSSKFEVPVSEVTAVPVILKEGFGKSLVLAIQEGDIIHEAPFPFLPGDEKRAMARELEELLAAPGASFSHSEDSRILAWIFCVVLVLFGLLSFIVIQDISLVMDRDEGTIHIDRKRRFLGQKDESNLNLSEFKTCKKELMEMSWGFMGLGKAGSYYIHIIDLEGNEIPITRGPMFTEKSAVKAVKLINNWVKK